MADGLQRNEVVAKSIVRMCQAEPKEVNFWWTGGLVIPSTGEKIPFYDIATIDIHRDFMNNFTDIITVEALMETRSFYTMVLPNMGDLEGWLHKKQMAENSTLFVRGGYNKVYNYKAILQNPPKNGLAGGQNPTNQIDNPDLSVTAVRFQFIDKTAIDLKLASFSGLMEQTEATQGLQMLMDGTGEDYGIEGVHMTEADVQIPRQIIIPRGTLVKDLPQYIQQEYGIYNFGIGSYIFNNEHGKFWWIYPLFNNNRYQKEYYKLTIVVVSSKFDPAGIPRTYMCNDGNLTLYTTDEVEMMENKPADQLNQGTGIQFRNTMENRGPNVEEAGINKQLIDGSVGVSTYDVVDRKDKLKNYVQIYDDVNNTAKLISSVSGNQGTYVTVQWRFAHADLLQPGVPTKIVYLDGDQAKELYGTLHEYHAVSVKQGITRQEVPYNCTAKLRIYVTPSPGVAV